MLSRHKVEAEKKRLRKFIEDAKNDPLARRIAQVAEEALRWASERVVGWESPVDAAAGWADIIRKDPECCPR